MNATKYRPSNGTEGAGFIEHFCANCARSDHNLKPEDREPFVGCAILDRTFALDVDDPDYPAEWIEDDEGARCTAFVQEGTELPKPRCPLTVDMFGDPT